MQSINQIAADRLPEVIANLALIVNSTSEEVDYRLRAASLLHDIAANPNLPSVSER